MNTVTSEPKQVDSIEHCVDLARRHAERFRERAERHDRENSFPFEDFEEMRESGYLAITVPEELGGAGAGLLALCRAQEALAEGAPATALGANMHLFTVGLAAEMWRETRDDKLEFFLRAVASGDMVVAASISELETSGNNFRHAATRAERVDGGYKITGRKIFCSISPVMTALTSHALYDDPDGPPRIVHFVALRESPGLQVLDNWDAMGMRPTGSNDVVLEEVFIPDELVMMDRPADQLDDFAFNSHRWFNVSFAAVYTGVAAGAKNYAETYARERTRKPYSRPMSHFPSIQYLVAEMELAIETSRALVSQVATEFDRRPASTESDFARVLAAKYVAGENAVAVVDKAMSVTGGSGYLRRSPLERLYRDVRGAKVHPPQHFDVLEIVGKAALDVPLDEQPRWG